MLAIYSLGIRGYAVIVKLASFFGNRKAKKWVAGRSNWRNILSKFSFDNPVWIHASSLGEFEQVKPLISKLKSVNPNKQIFVTFFSPSGYENANLGDDVDFVSYLPADLKSNCKDFLNIVNPSSVVFVKYDFWLNYINELDKRNIPLMYFGCNFRANQPFFKWFGSWQLKHLAKADTILHLNESSLTIGRKISVENQKVCGDTRVDRVLKIVEEDNEIPFFDDFSKNEKVLILGSSWPLEEKLLANSNFDFKKDWKLIIAPHDISESHINSIEQTFNGITRLSSNPDPKSRAVIIDSIGLLSKVYKYTDVAFIGGGMTNSLHNILEPAAMKCALIFGDNCGKFPEGDAITRLGGAIQINDAKSLDKALLFFNNKQNLNQAKEKANQYILSNKGATTIVFDELTKLDQSI